MPAVHWIDCAQLCITIPHFRQLRDDLAKTVYLSVPKFETHV